MDLQALVAARLEPKHGGDAEGQRRGAYGAHDADEASEEGDLSFI